MRHVMVEWIIKVRKSNTKHVKKAGAKLLEYRYDNTMAAVGAVRILMLVLFSVSPG
jgi:hypothetical protein